LKFTEIVLFSFYGILFFEECLLLAKLVLSEFFKISEDDMKDKVVLITGGTSGIGRQTALDLAPLGARIVIVGRNKDKAEETVRRLKELGAGEAKAIIADLSSLHQVKKAADEFLAQYERLDVLLNNAGSLFIARSDSADGYEMSLALNHLSYFALTHHLFALLKKTAEHTKDARIINVSSEAHKAAKNGILFEDLQRRQSYSGWERYGESKLANIYFTYSLDEKFAGNGLTVNALHPGFVDSGFGDNNRGWFQWFFSPIKKLFARSEAKGAETSVHLASADNLKGVSGKYFVDKKVKKTSPVSYDPESRERLWRESLQLTGITSFGSS
jgi:NAD(P)-dependent dehydrogenase (short-subunit alcohol dehydrogenase family)